MTAAGDAVVGPLRIARLYFAGTGLAAGESLLVRTAAGGSVVGRYYIGNAEENADLVNEPGWYSGLYIEEFPASGGTLVVELR